MAEQIGQLIPTQIASLSETADIQEAFRLYHYGAPSGTGIGDYDPTNTNPANLIQPSIAYSLNFLNDKVTFLESNLGVQATLWSAKGAIVTASAANTPATLTVSASSGFVLTSDSSTVTGLKWAAPEVTLSNTVELLNKTIDLTGNTISGTLAEFNTALSDDDFVSLTGTETLTNKTLTAPTLSTPSITTPTVTDATVVMTGGTPDLTFNVSANGSTSYVIDLVQDPTLSVVKGRTYSFIVDAPGQQFWLQTTPAPYNAANVITTGITNNGTSSGTITYTVPSDGSVTEIYYVSQFSATMTGTINIIDPPSFSTSVKSYEASATREILFPNASGTVITTGNLSDIVSLGQIVSVYASGPVVGHPNVYPTSSTNPILIPSYDGGILTSSATDPVIVQIPNDFIEDPLQNFPTGSQVTVIQIGDGQVSFAGSGSATVSGSPGLKLRAKYSSATLIKIAVNTWIVSGDLVA